MSSVSNPFEVYFALYFVARCFTEPLLQEYVRALTYHANHDILCNEGLNPEFNCNISHGQLEPIPEQSRLFEPCPEGKGDDWVPVLQELYEKAEYHELQIMAVEYAPTIVVVFLFATLSDFMLRRHFLIWMPTIGQVGIASALLVDFYTPWLQDKSIYIGAALSGVSGGATVFMVGTAVYICDMVKPKKRIVRFLVVELLFEAIGSVCWPAVVFWIRSSGFSGVIWLNFALSVLAFNIIFRQMEDAEILNRDTREFHFGTFFNKMKTWTRKSTKKPRVRILLLLLATLMMYTLVSVAFFYMVSLHLIASPFCFNLEHLAVYLTMSKVYNALGLGLMVGLSKHYDVKTLTIVGMLSFAAGSLVIGLVDDDVWTIYVAALVLFLYKTPHGLLRSYISHFTKDRIALTFAMLHGGHALFFVISRFVFHYGFLHIKLKYRRLAFGLVVVMVTVPLTITGRMLYLQKRRAHKVEIYSEQQESSIKRRMGTVLPPKAQQLQPPENKQFPSDKIREN